MERKIDQTAQSYELLPRLSDTPDEADFSMTITDESMEPYIKKNSLVYIQARAQLEELDAGIFLYEGRILCRQWCEDYMGKVHLLCANPNFERENIALDREEQKKLVCVGKVLMKKKLPAPIYR